MDCTKRILDRQAWINSATSLMKCQNDIQIATAQFHVLMDRIDEEHDARCSCHKKPEKPICNCVCHSTCKEDRALSSHNESECWCSVPDAGCRPPERDYYTREEIDEKVTYLIDAVQLLSEAIDEHGKREDKAQELSYKCRKIMEEKKEKEEREWRKALLDALGKFFIAYKKTDAVIEKGWMFDLDEIRKRFT